MAARKFCTSIAISLLIFFYPFSLQAQVVIKDTVAITPKAAAGNFAVSSVALPITFNFTWEPTADPGFPFSIDVYHCKE